VFAWTRDACRGRTALSVIPSEPKPYGDIKPPGPQRGKAPYGCLLIVFQDAPNGKHRRMEMHYPTAVGTDQLAGPGIMFMNAAISIAVVSDFKYLIHLAASRTRTGEVVGMPAEIHAVLRIACRRLAGPLLKVDLPTGLALSLHKSADVLPGV